MTCSLGPAWMGDAKPSGGRGRGEGPQGRSPAPRRSAGGPGQDGKAGQRQCHQHPAGPAVGPVHRVCDRELLIQDERGPPRILCRAASPVTPGPGGDRALAAGPAAGCAVLPSGKIVDRPLRASVRGRARQPGPTTTDDRGPPTGVSAPERTGLPTRRAPRFRLLPAGPDDAWITGDARVGVPSATHRAQVTCREGKEANWSAALVSSRLWKMGTVAAAVSW